MDPAGVLRAADEAHGVVEGETEDLGVEVDGVAGEVALGPAPEGVFYDETLESGQGKVAGIAWDEKETALFAEEGGAGRGARRGFVRGTSAG